MFVKKMSIFTALLVILLHSIPCNAKESHALLQSYTFDDMADMYISGNLDIDSLTVNVSNQPAEVMESGSLADMDVTVRTTILLDISQSMPESMRENVIEYINCCIGNLSTKEELKIVLFGEKVTVIQDFTSDRYDLSKVVETIEFNGKQSMLYDAIYNTIPELIPIENKPCYYRTMIVTDGIDEADSGVTKEELYLRLQESLYPVDVVVVSESEKNAAEKELSALTRISGGRYVTLNEDSDIEDIYLELDSVTWIRVKLPGEITDGSVRQFDISDGIEHLQFDLKVPVYDEGDSEQETSKGVESEQTDEDADLTSSLETTAEKNITNEETENIVKNSAIWIYVAFAILALICIILIVIFLKSKKKKQTLRLGGPQAELQSYAQSSEDETRILIAGNKVCLKMVDDPVRMWELDFDNEIIIGRNESCHVILDDQSVSRKQCVLYLDENECLMIKNLSTSNITRVNNVKLDTPHLISEGDRIRCGKTVLIVDSVKREYENQGNDINKMTHYVNV